MNEQVQMNQRTLDLLHGSVDRELGADEQEELDALLASSDDVRAVHEELKRLATLLDDLPQLEPPAYLRDSIERQLRVPTQSSLRNDGQGSFGSWLSARSLRTGFAVAAGVILTVGIYEMGSEPISDMDATNLAGTVVQNPANGQGELVDRIQISNDALSGSVELRKKDDLFTLDVRLNSDGPTELVVNYAGRGLEYEGITQEQEHNDAVKVADGSINVASSGEHRYLLKLRRNAAVTGQQPPPLELEIFANNSLVQKASLSVHR